MIYRIVRGVWEIEQLLKMELITITNPLSPPGLIELLFLHDVTSFDSFTSEQTFLLY